MLAYEALFLLAATQLGYFTVEQAHEFGISSRMVLHHASTGRFQRVARGVYRFRDFPDPASDIPVAWLAVCRQTDGRAVVSHESALYVHDLSDALPRAIDVSVERSRRGIKLPPHPPIRLHTGLSWPSGDEVEERSGVVVTSPVRTVVDCALARTEGLQIIRGVRQARNRGWLTDRQLLEHARARGPQALRLIEAVLAEASPGSNVA